MFAFLTDFCFLDISRFCPGVLGLLRLPVQVGTEAPECCRGQAREPVHRQHPAVYWADIVQRIIRFPLPQVTELSEAQFLWLQKKRECSIRSVFFFIKSKQTHFIHSLCSYLYFGRGGERHVACGVAVFSLLLHGLRPHQCREGSGEVAAEQRLLWRDI